MTPAQEARLKELLARTDPNDPTYPGLTEDEAAEIRQIILGVDQNTARFITAIERGEIEDDLIEINPEN